MHFVICVFISLVCLVSTILFRDVFHKFVKIVLGVIGSYTAGYALAILIRKVAEWTGAFAQPKLFMTVWICFAVVLVATIITSLVQKKKA